MSRYGDLFEQVLASTSPLEFTQYEGSADIYRQLTHRLLDYLHLFSTEDLVPPMGSSTNFRKEANELLCGLLHEMEQQCDYTYGMMDMIMQRVTLQPFSILDERVSSLRLCRGMLVIIARQYPIDLEYSTDNAIIPLRAHLGATYHNLSVTIDDAEMVSLGLFWLHKLNTLAVVPVESQPVQHSQQQQPGTSQQ